MGHIYYAYALVRQLLQPWWAPNEHRLPPEKKKEETPEQKDPPKKIEPQPVRPMDTDPNYRPPTGPTEFIGYGEALPSNLWGSVEKGIFVSDLPEGMPDDITEMTQFPPAQHVWHYHDHERHELLSHFLPMRGFDFKGRRDDRRKNLKAAIYPINNNKPFDRTHLIPFGYHGSEADPKLLVGWDSVQNQGPMNSFEQRQKKRMKPIFWLARIEKNQHGATLTYKVYDVATMDLVDEESYTMKSEFHWSPRI